MDVLNTILLILHFLGLTLGFSASFANMTMAGLIKRSQPAERGILARFPPLMGKVGRIGLALLWVTGVIMVFTRWNGFGSLPWQFHVKLTAVVLLTVAVEYIRRLEQQASRGDAAAAARVQQVGKLSGLFAMTALIFAVLTFD